MLKFLLNEIIDLSLHNLLPKQAVSIKVSCIDWFGNEWRSNATFIANDQGLINPAKQAPVEGSYQNVEPMGLFWSMLPVNSQAPHFFMLGDDLSTKVRYTTGDKLLFEKIFTRTVRSPDVVATDFKQKSLTGKLYHYSDGRRAPGIIVVSGSNGGVPTIYAQLLAAQGYTVLALGYFGADGLPEQLANIDLNSFEIAINWLRKSDYVFGNKITLVGNSRGGELVLLLATIFQKDIQAVVSYVPSSVAYGAFPQITQPAWNYNGQSIPAVLSGLTNAQTESEDLAQAVNAKLIPHRQNTITDPYIISDLFLAKMNTNKIEYEKATIPIEKISCPVLILSGEDDKIWPSSVYAKQIIKRAYEYEKQSNFTWINFDHAGHDFMLPNLPSADLAIYHPVGGFWCRFGGTMLGNARASQESWQHVIRFLKNSFNHNAA